MKSAVVNSVLMGLPVPLGAHALAKYKPWKLLIYLPAAVGFVTAWRKFICARCQFYGKQCSTVMGITTAMLMPRDESRPLDRNAMIADFSYIGALVLFPLPQVMKRTGLAALYLASATAAVTAILLNACPRCGNDFCPMKDVHRIITGSKV
jgi:hypothetical protein